MEGYKAFNKDWKCIDFQYEIGQIYELPKGQTLKMCERGFHFCKNPIDVFGYYPFDNNTMIAKVEALGKIEQEGTKYVTDKIKIVREFTRNELQALILNGKYNTRENNSGDYNSGYYNSGDYNSGYYNSGNYNSGNYNSGCYNSGDYNSGDYNSGYFNSGDFNSGDFNSGNFNSGNCNSGCYNSGIFNTNEPCMRAFNKQTSIRYADFLRSLDYSFEGLCLRISKKNLIPEDTERIKALPNFDAEIFKEITGIELKDGK